MNFLASAVALITAVNSILIGSCGMKKQDLPNVPDTQKIVFEDKTAVKEYTQMNNAKYLLDRDKKLTLGYLGGSITNGYTAASKVVKGHVLSAGGNLELNYVNRITSWFRETYPDAVIESVNAGISDTATNFGIYRLRDNLMNENGHDMPDVVFVEFTVNDWVLSGCVTQGEKELSLQAESLVGQIYECNPYADIVFVYTARSSCTQRNVYNKIAKQYNIPAIDMGIPMQKLMDKNGASQESEGKYRYTVDNLHPSVEGYGVYAEEVTKKLSELLEKAPAKWLLEPLSFVDISGQSEYLMKKPEIIPAQTFKVSGTYEYTDFPASTYPGTNVKGSTPYKPAEKALYVKSDDVCASFSFTGTSLGFIFAMQSGADINMDYRVDGGEWKNFGINADFLSFQRYGHNQIYINEMYLENKQHTVELRFGSGSDGKTNVKLVCAAVS